uniref:Uncharacterized protein n=1 Tax=Spumella elongata TaxID=89044 RepID=A0A7S3M097_9STRA|mmetsp:Transcript_15910/g.27985  ORF Transcript_15910/g.27985 Transcript_15910/m.27985 type:complete len:302 (+) Transcript_15910:44-949(+)
MLLRRSFLLVRTKLTSVPRCQQLRSIRIPGAAGREVPKAVKMNQRVNVQEPMSETKVRKAFNFGRKYGPTLFKVVSATIANGPKVLFGLLVCGSVGCLYYLKNYYGIQYDNFKSGVSDKLKGAKNKVSESLDSLKASANAARERAGQSVDSACDTVRGSYEKVTGTLNDMNPIPAIAERSCAANDKIVKSTEHVADKVSELKGRWSSTADSADKPLEPSVPLSEKLNALKQKAVDKLPSFGRKPVDEVMTGNPGIQADKVDETLTDDTAVGKGDKVQEGIASKVADIKDKWFNRSKDSGEK